MGWFRNAKCCRAIFAAIALVLASATAAIAERRIALVFGNSAYVNVTKLKNAVTDADAVAARLGALGFEVIKATDATRGRMNEAIGAFLEKAGPDTDAVIFFAGHGVELGGSNYLLPVDVPQLRPGQERLLRVESISLTDLLQELEGRNSRVSVVVLDACRDNPFPPQGTRSLGSTRGLARVDPPAGAFVVFSAGAGEQALDVLGPDDKNRHGVFTRRFLSLMDEPGLELRQMVLKLRRDVVTLARSVSHRQTPSYYDQMTGSFYFRPNEPAPPQKAAAAAGQGPVVGSLILAPVEPQAGPARTPVVDLRLGRFIVSPQLDGMPLAWCKTSGSDCGFPAADAFCQREGSPAARIVSAKSGKASRFIGGGPDCAGDNCPVFSGIHCIPASGLRRLEKGFEALVGDVYWFDANCRTMGYPTVTIRRQPESGELVARKSMSKVFGATGPYAHCNGRDVPSLMVFFKPKADFSGKTIIEFSRKHGEHAVFHYKLNIEVLP